MNEAVLFYNPFLPEMKVSINGACVSRYSAINSMRSAHFASWCTDILPEIRKEVNGNFSLRCISTNFICDCMEQIAGAAEYCTGFVKELLAVNDTVYERIEELKHLGLRHAEEIVVPLFAVSDRALTEELYDLICDDGLFEEEETDLVWDECPPAGLRLHLIRQEREIPRRSQMVLVFCGSDNDRISLSGNYDIYAIVPGLENRFLKKERRCLYYEADPDELGQLILEIVAEGALSAFLSEMAARLEDRNPSDEMKLKLTYVCAGRPVYLLQVEEVLDVGREYDVSCKAYPPAGNVRLRYGTDRPELITAGASSMQALSEGRAYVFAYMDGDPYPVAAKPVAIRNRNLIRNLQGDPEVVLPEGGIKEVRVFMKPADAVNADEISWSSSNESVIHIEGKERLTSECRQAYGELQESGAVYGVISARSQGRCGITVSTPEARCEISCYVLPAIESIWTSLSNVEVKVGQYQTFRYSARPRGAYGESELSASSDNPSVAEYQDGYIVGKSKGRCTIRVRTKDQALSAEVQVTVKKGLFG